MVDRRLSTLIAIVTVVLATLVLWSAFAPRTRRAGQRTVAADSQRRGPAPRPAPSDVRRVEPPTPPEPPPNRLGYFDLMARAESRRRIRASAGYTYLSEIVAESGDSVLRRWDDRNRRPVRVYLPGGGTVEPFQAAFLDAVREAFERWGEAGVPVQFNVDADSLDAEVVFRWRVRFDIDRTGQTDLIWNQDGHIVSGVVTIATLDPTGNPLGPDDVRVVALHEIGHLIGLDHSSDSSDVMFASTRVRDLSARDIRTALLLYQLAPGSLR